MCSLKFLIFFGNYQKLLVLLSIIIIKFSPIRYLYIKYFNGTALYFLFQILVDTL